MLVSLPLLRRRPLFRPERSHPRGPLAPRSAGSRTRELPGARVQPPPRAASERPLPASSAR
eukprot:8142971-Alexandrium_andersonii.AAC.1